MTKLSAPPGKGMFGTLTSLETLKGVRSAGGPPEWPLEILQHGVAPAPGSPVSLSVDLFFTLAGSWPLPSHRRAGTRTARNEPNNPATFPFAKHTEIQTSPPPELRFGPNFYLAEQTGVIIVQVENLRAQGRGNKRQEDQSGLPSPLYLV